jgi:hypothetical protein
MADPGTPDWWLDRLYKRLRDRQPRIRLWNDLYTGRHPVPAGHEDAQPLFARLMETVGLNMLAVVTDAALDRMQITGFSVGGKALDEAWELWQANNFDLGSEQVRQEKMALSEAYVLVDPNGGQPIVTPEHPEQCIVECAPGSSRKRVAGLKVWQDDVSGPTPMVKAFLDLGSSGVYTWAAPTRIYADYTNRSALAMKPSWELQPTESGANPLGEVAFIPFGNRARMLAPPVPEFEPAIAPQKRINKTLLDRMAMQDQGSFKAMWATGINIPRDPVTKKPVESFVKAIDRQFINENPDGRFGQLDAEDIKQMLEAVRDDIADCAIAVPTSADQVMAKLVNVSGDGLKLAQVSEIKRVKRHIRHESEPWEDVARLMLKAAGKSVPNAEQMKTNWQNPEYRTDTEAANAATVAIGAGMPEEVAWQRYFNAGPDEVKDWARQRDEALMVGLKPPPPPPPPPGAGDADSGE